MLKNPFPSPTPLQKVMLNELSRVASLCYDRGWSWGTAGNFSIRGSNGLIWQSPTGICKADLDTSLYVPVLLESETPAESYTLRPSAEMPVHAGIYKSRPDAMCVVHTHPFEVVSASCHSLELVFEGEEMSKALGAKSHLETIKIPILDNPTPTEMNVFSSRVESGIGDVAKVVVLKGHGVYAWGKTPLEAMAYLEALEFLCKGRRYRG